MDKGGVVMEHLINHYNELKNKLSISQQQSIDLPVLTPCNLSVNEGTEGSIIKETHASLQEAIKAFQPLQGWLCFQSKVVSLTDGNLECLDDSKSGWILSGELSNANRDSLHINPHGNGSWLLTFYQEQEGQQLLRQPVTYLGTGESPGKLEYAVYWRHDAAVGYQKAFSRFIGFQQEQS